MLITPGFEPVADKLEALLETTERGAAFAAYLDGELVVDIWGGEARPGQPWQENTLSAAFSSTKGANALCAQILADRGLLDVEAPVRQYWPEFADERVLVKHCLSHTAGVLVVPGWHDFISPPNWLGLTDAEEITRRLASSVPAWEPGTKIAYHAFTVGWLVAEVVRRIDGRRIGRFFHEEVAQPLGLDLWIGLPESEDNRVTLQSVQDASGNPAAEAMREMMLAQLTPGSLITESMFVVDGASPLLDIPSFVNQRAVRACEMSAGSGIGTARSLACMYAPLSLDGSLDGVRLVGPQLIKEWSQVQFSGPSEFLGAPMSYALGYQAAAPELTMPDGTTIDGFGHGGAGGQIGWADPSRRLSFALLKNHGHMLPTSAVALAQTLYECL